MGSAYFRYEDVWVVVFCTRKSLLLGGVVGGVGEVNVSCGGKDVFGSVASGAGECWVEPLARVATVFFGECQIGDRFPLFLVWGCGQATL